MPKKKRNLIIIVIAVLLLTLVVFSLAISPSETTKGYTFVESISIEKIFDRSSYWTKVFPLKEGEWVILSGKSGILFPQWKKIGGRDKCYVVGIKGPTNKTYTIISIIYFVGVVSSHNDWDWWIGTFEEDFLEKQDSERKEEHCSDGLTVFTLPVR